METDEDDDESGLLVNERLVGAGGFIVDCVELPLQKNEDVLVDMI
jgi:hypothetical protein